MRIGAQLAVLLSLCACGGAPERSVVLVVIDTLRADRTSLMGYDRPTTPSLEALGAEGTVYERAFSTSSWTMPSMASLMTGQARSTNRGELYSWQLSLAEHFRAAGHRTGAVVSNPLLNAEQGYARGFQHFEIFQRERGAGRRGTNGWSAQEVSRRAIEWLDGVGDEPFFLWLHYFDPHDPYRPGPKFSFEARDDLARRARLSEALPVDQRAELTDEVYGELERQMALYDGEVAQADAGLGLFVEHLRSSGRLDSTLVAVTADHGEGLWQRAPLSDETYDKPNAYFPRLYFDHGIMLHDEQVHVPLVLRGPGVPAGARSGLPLSLLDVAPTLLDGAGLEAGQQLHGTSLLASGYEPRRELYAACSRGTSLTVDDRWRLHLPRDYRLERGATPELYDLSVDAGETRALVAPEREAAMRAALERWAGIHADEAGFVPASTAQAALLEELGYTGGEADVAPPSRSGEDQ